MKRALATLVAFLLAATLLPMTASPASAARPESGASFNVPPKWGGAKANFNVIRKIESAINSTRPTRSDPKPAIWITTYFLDRASSADALIRACKRGVSVRVIIDSGIQDKPAKKLIAALNSDNVRDRNKDGKPDRPARSGPCNRKMVFVTESGQRVVQRPVDPNRMTRREVERSVAAPNNAAVTWGKDGSYVKRCKGSCRGGGGAMHSKFFVFTSTGGVKDVVMVSSGNLNLGAAIRGWNDMITFTKRNYLRRAFARIHRQMTEDRPASRQVTRFVDGGVTARFFPLRSGSRANDPTLADLNRIKCKSAIGPTQIRISMFYWAHERGKYLARKVINLAKAGCRVSVIYGAPGDAVRRMLNDAANKGLLSLYDSRLDLLTTGDGAGDYRVRTHGKFMLVQGTYGNNRKAFLTTTGSQNWAQSSLAGGDEVTVNVMSRSVYKQYRAHYDRIRSHSKRR